MNTMKSLSLPVLTDSNFELWRQNLNLVTLALDVPDALAKDIKGLECKDPKLLRIAVLKTNSTKKANADSV